MAAILYGCHIRGITDIMFGRIPKCGSCDKRVNEYRFFRCNPMVADGATIRCARCHERECD